MKVIVIGATGTVGNLAVKAMLEAGHQVTAFARSPEKLELDHDSLTLAAGNVLDRTQLRAAMQGHDAVVVTLGSGMARKSTIRSEGTLAVIQTMQELGIKRLICQSTLGAHESWSNLNFFWKRIMFGAYLRPVFKDHELQESLVRASGLDWTLVRPSAFADGPATGDFKQGFGPEERDLTLKITRADIAQFLQEQLGDLSHLHRAVAISQ